MDKALVELLDMERGRWPKRQRQIARYIMENSQSASFMTAKMLADAAGVSESSVVRFARQLGYQGYSQLRKALQELVKAKLQGLGEIEQTDREDSLVKTVEDGIGSMRQLLQPQNHLALEDGRKALLSCRRVLVMASEGMEGLDTYFQRSLERLGINAKAVAKGDIMSIDELDRDSLLLLLADSPEGLIGPARLARIRAASVLLIRQGNVQPLDKMAGIALESKDCLGAAALMEALLRAVEAELGMDRLERLEQLRGKRKELEDYELDEN